MLTGWRRKAKGNTAVNIFHVCIKLRSCKSLRIFDGEPANSNSKGPHLGIVVPTFCSSLRTSSGRSRRPST